MFSRRLVNPTSKRALFSNAAILAFVGLIGSVLVVPLVGNSTPTPSITAPGIVSLSTAAADQDPGDFVLEDFPAQDLLVTIGLVDPPADTNFTISVTEGLTFSYGYSSWVDVTEVSFVASNTGTSSLVRANAALASMLISTGTTPGTVEFNISAMPSVSGVAFNPVNQHFYKAVTPAQPITWGLSRELAEEDSYDGVPGYLATITSQQENDFITNRIENANNIWIGGSDAASEGTWRWVTGPEGLEDDRLGRVFWVGGTNGTAIGFASWDPGREPNNGGSSGNQHYALTNWESAGNPNTRGLWDDQSGTQTNAGYLVEFSQTDAASFTNLRTTTLSLPLVESSITAPASPELAANLDNQNIGDFVLSNFPVGDLLVSVGLVSPPTDTTFRITETSGLQRSFGYDSWSGLTEISFVAESDGGNAQDRANAALASMQVSTGNFGGPLTLKVSAIPNPTGVAFNPVNQNFYKYVASPAITFADSVTAAASVGQKFDGVTGYLVTITSSQENDFVAGNIQGAENLWIGATDVSIEGVWRWVTGPEGAMDSGLGQVFWTAACAETSPPSCTTSVRQAPSSTAGNLFASWASNEPNNSSFEHNAVTNWNVSTTPANAGKWNDLGGSNSNNIDGYVIEYSEWNGQQFQSLRRAETTAAIPDPPAVTDNPGGSGGGSPTPTPAVTPTPTSPTGPSDNTPRPQQQPNPAPALGPALNPPAPLAGPVAIPANGSNGGGAIVRGEEVPLESTSSSEQDLSVTAGEVNLNFNVPGGSGGVNNSGGSPVLEVKRDKAVSLEGEGMLPGSTVQVWLPGASGEKEVGRLAVGPDGSFEGDISFAAAPGGAPLPIGQQVVQLTGVDRNGDQTVINLNVNIAQPDPSPELFRGQTVTPQPGFGNFEASNAGLPEQATLTAITADKQALVEGAGWSLSLQLSGEGSGITENSDGVFMTLVRGEAANFGGDGFMPGTIASIWLFSDPTKLGEVTIAADGSFSGVTGPLDAAIATGEHTIQIQGVGFDGYIRSANLGVLVTEPALAAAPFAFFDWIPLALLGLLLLAGAFFIIAARRRKKADGSNVIQFPQAA